MLVLAGLSSYVKLTMMDVISNSAQQKPNIQEIMTQVTESVQLLRVLIKSLLFNGEKLRKIKE